MKHEAVAQILRLVACDGGGRPSGEGWEMYPCPLAATRHDRGEDRKPSLGIKIGVGQSGFICHACGISGGSLYWLIRACRIDGIIDDAQAREAYQQIKWVESHEPETPDIEEEVEPTLDPSLLDDLSTMHPYYAQRKFTETEVFHWRLGARKNMLLFPCVLADGSIPFIQARLTDQKAFWYLPTGIRRHHVLGSHLLTGTERAIVFTEGVFDAMRVRRAIRKLDALAEMGVVCALGSKPNPQQLDHLFSLTRDELIIASDGDHAGDLCADKLEDVAKHRVKIVSRVMLPTGKDPDNVGTAKLVNLITARENLLIQRMRQLLGNQS